VSADETFPVPRPSRVPASPRPRVFSARVSSLTVDRDLAWPRDPRPRLEGPMLSFFGVAEAVNAELLGVPDIFARSDYKSSASLRSLTPTARCAARELKRTGSGGRVPQKIQKGVKKG